MNYFLNIGKDYELSYRFTEYNQSLYLYFEYSLMAKTLTFHQNFNFNFSSTVTKVSKVTKFTKLTVTLIHVEYTKLFINNDQAIYNL